ncbi:hypothetical protein Y032_1020g3409 [Ancylostoma ceylanicum]|uniref:Uncharacterized protein n=1 Tax=Ancylostoma ceylanicum TaxID=53326 RepID=A0A016W7N5_9BILA|nr:hypothetical protein Y032_1020g3409 [Ancylostoma ceylanicum]
MSAINMSLEEIISKNKVTVGTRATCTISFDEIIVAFSRNQSQADSLVVFVVMPSASRVQGEVVELAISGGSPM